MNCRARGTGVKCGPAPVLRMSSRHIRWLRGEISRWSSAGLVTPEQAERLLGRYPEPPDGGSWGRLLFAGAGAVVIGLGVILLFAYNWEALPKGAKLAVVFLALGGAHAGGLARRARTGETGAAVETAHLLGTMLFGAGIWLVAQIYHIEEHYPTGFLVWALGALALAWALDSVPQGLLAAGLLGGWSTTEAFGFRAPEFWAVPLVLAGLGPLAWRRRSVVLATAVLAMGQWLLVVNLVALGAGALALATSLGLGAGLVACGHWAARADSGVVPLARVLRRFGWAAFFVCAVILGSASATRAVLRDGFGGIARQPLVVWTHVWLPLAGAAAAWGVLAFRQWRRLAPALPPLEWTVPAGLGVVCMAGLLSPVTAQDALAVALVFNLMAVAVAGGWMWHGSRSGRMGLAVFGSACLGVVVLARYGDLFQSLAARGLAFILFGGALLTTAVYCQRQRRAAPGKGARP